MLLELLVGYHEINDVSFVTADFADGPAAVDRADSELRSAEVVTPQVGHAPRDGFGPRVRRPRPAEDEFIDSVLGKVRDSKIGHNAATGTRTGCTSDLSAERAGAALGRRRAAAEAEDPLPP